MDIITNIITINIVIITFIIIFQTYPNALCCFLVKSQVVSLVTTTDVQAKLPFKIKSVSTYRILSGGSYDSSKIVPSKESLDIVPCRINILEFEFKFKIGAI